MEDVVPILALKGLRGFGNQKINSLLSDELYKRASTPEELFSQLKELGSWSKSTLDEVKVAWRQSERLIQVSQENDITILSKWDAEFPKQLLGLRDCPILLHIRGDPVVLKKKAVAVVGTRDPTDYGKKVAGKVTKKLCGEYVIVSGLAQGIDTEAHLSTLKHKGITVAILAHGLHTVFPPENRELADQIVEAGGALVSEYPLYTNYARYTFVQRDRIQSGLSEGVFVIESDEEGGTMHTARYCLEQNRKLFVLQHPEKFKANPQSQGNLKLLKGRGAIPFREDTPYETILKSLKSSRAGRGTLEGWLPADQDQ